MTEQQAHYLLIYMALIAFSFLIAAVALAAVGFAVARLIKHVTALTDEAKGKVYLLMDRVERIAAKTEQIAGSAEAIVADLQPKIERVTTNIADTSDVYRAKVAQVDALITDTAGKARRQSDRVDGMITAALTRTGEIAAHLHNAIMTPARQLSGMINGAKASLESLVHHFGPKPKLHKPEPVAFEGESVYTGLEDDYHA